MKLQLPAILLERMIGYLAIWRYDPKSQMMTFWISEVFTEVKPSDIASMMRKGFGYGVMPCDLSRLESGWIAHFMVETKISLDGVEDPKVLRAYMYQVRQDFFHAIEMVNSLKEAQYDENREREGT